MPFIPVPSVAQVNVNQRLHGERVQNTLYGVNFGGITPENLELLAGEIITWVAESLYPALSQDISLAEVQCRDLSVADGAIFVGVPTVSVEGGQVSPALPGNAAACVSFRTGLAGRSRRGRNYVAGLPEFRVSGNIISDPFVTDLQNAYNVLLAPTGPFVASGFAWVVVSRYSGVDPVTGEPIPRAFGQPTVINAVQVDNLVDSQRRRLAGRGT